MAFTFVSLISGSSGNATFVSDGKTNLLIDCGMSGAKLKEAMKVIDAAPENITALLLTHEHIDHTKGAGVISRRYNIPIYATEGTHTAMDAGKIDDNNIKLVRENVDFEIGGIGIKPFAIPHDARQPVGYCLFSGGEKYSVATDMGNMNEDILSNITGSKKILLESNHDVEMLRCGSYPYPLKRRILGDLGHLSNEAAAKTALYLVQNGTRHIILGHLSMENNRPEIAMLETYNLLSQSGVNVGDDVTLQVADRYKPTLF
ncbi:MAG: MBL fold metallo-hydrolase [Firmicutes bacterium]|nr:MBL fold metallo-hydrolase [Bacillota bacterium]